MVVSIDYISILVKEFFKGLEFCGLCFFIVVEWNGEVYGKSIVRFLMFVN